MFSIYLLMPTDFIFCKTAKHENKAAAGEHFGFVSPNKLNFLFITKSDQKVYDPPKVYDHRKFSKCEGGCNPGHIYELDHPNTTRS